MLFLLCFQHVQSTLCISLSFFFPSNSTINVLFSISVDPIDVEISITTDDIVDVADSCLEIHVEGIIYEFLIGFIINFAGNNSDNIVDNLELGLVKGNSFWEGRA